MDGALFASRMAPLSLGVLGVMGAMLAITGIFGMAAYSVSKRLRELGIRIALGAQRKEVLQAALGRAFRIASLWFRSRIAPRNSGEPGARFHRVSGHVRAIRWCWLVLFSRWRLLGLLATWIPAQRALSVDPVILLREE